MTNNDWWNALPFIERGMLAGAFHSVANLPRVWQDTAETTRSREGPSSEYAKGIASGLDIAAKQLQEGLGKLAKATPACPHGRPLLATCRECIS